MNAFWSITMYELPSQLLIKNPINRYLINSPMLPGLKKDTDGGVTLYIQAHSPGKDKQANWLPAPNGPFRDVRALLLAATGVTRRPVENAAGGQSALIVPWQSTTKARSGNFYLSVSGRPPAYKR